jgi:hypothetical protein
VLLSSEGTIVRPDQVRRLIADESSGGSGNEALHSGVGADERFGDLDGVGRRALEQVVGYAPVLDDVTLDAHPPDVGFVLSDYLERRREVVRELDAGRRSQRLEHLG